MASQIDADTLREWLDAKRPVTVLDIRTNDARAQWSIPGSIHVNAYEDVREGRPGALAQAELPRSQPVVTVCNAGRVSQTAADLLTGFGFDARSLAGGMKEIGDSSAPEEAFIDRVISRLPDTPPNFARIVELNEAGEFRAGDPTELEAGANRCAIA